MYKTTLFQLFDGSLCIPSIQFGWYTKLYNAFTLQFGTTYVWVPWRVSVKSYTSSYNRRKLSPCKRRLFWLKEISQFLAAARNACFMILKWIKYTWTPQLPGRNACFMIWEWIKYSWTPQLQQKARQNRSVPSPTWSSLAVWVIECDGYYVTYKLRPFFSSFQVLFQTNSFL